MKKKRDLTDMPIGKLTRVKDFLPLPHQLIFPEAKKKKITIELDIDTLEFFQAAAKKNHSKYQRLIRAALQLYVHQIKKTK